MSTWHYLPVFVEHDGSHEYSMCEVYLDDAGLVDAWTESHQIAPSGRSADELRADLEQMLGDLSCWRPIEFASLEVGMRLKARASATPNG